MAQMKTCSRCKKTKAKSAFHKRSTAKDGLQANCKECGLLLSGAWTKNNKERKAELSRSSWMRIRFKMTIAEYNVLLAKQGGECAICHSIAPGGVGRFHVDHDHVSGRIRGLLCTNCNNGLGRFEDNPDRLIMAAKYITDSLHCLEEVKQ